jgi:hypothetical protein
MPLVMIDVGVKPGKIAEITALLDGVKNGMEQVVTRAINKVGVAARTRIVRRIVQEVNLKAGELRDRNVSLKKASYRRLTASVFISGRRIPLLRWGARQTSKGVSYAITRGQRTVMSGAFMESHGRPITMKSGHRGVFARAEMEGGLRAGRLPIRELRGPSVPAVVEGIQELSEAVLDKQIAEQLDGEIDTQLGLVLQRRGRR